MDLFVSSSVSVLTCVVGFLVCVLLLPPFLSLVDVFLTVVLLLVLADAVSPVVVFLTTFLVLPEVGVDFILGDCGTSWSSDTPSSGFCGVDFLLDVFGVVLVAGFVVFVDVRVDLALVGLVVLGVVFFVAGGVSFLAVNKMFH